MCIFVVIFLYSKIILILKIIDWLFRKKQMTDIDKTFGGLLRWKHEKDRCLLFEQLKALNENTTLAESELLIANLKAVQFSSNTNSVFEFNFPKVCHILYFKPEYENQILSLIVGPSFANAIIETNEMIAFFQSVMTHCLAQNKYFLTPEGQSWIVNELPNMEIQIEREIQSCWKELED